MEDYHIIDEPKVKKAENLIVNPIVILFAAIFIPLFWMPPLYGRWWIPLVWLTINGYLLGSPSLKSEIITSVLGLIALFGLLEVFIIISEIDPYSQFDSLVHYARIILNGVFFFIVYLVVFKQTTPFEIYSYMKER